jgi:hypothetical protein
MHGRAAMNHRLQEALAGKQKKRLSLGELKVSAMIHRSRRRSPPHSIARVLFFAVPFIVD